MKLNILIYFFIALTIILVVTTLSTNQLVNTPQKKSVDKGTDNNVITKEEIVSSEITYDCKIKVTTNRKEYFLPTKYNSLSSKCYQFVLNKVSPSKSYVVFQDISGGLDSAIKLYSLKLNETFLLDILGTSNINDLTYLPDNRLAVLNGYQGEMYLRIYNLDGLISEYPNNFDEKYKYFKGPGFVKYLNVITLPKGQDFHSLSVGDNNLYLYGNAGISAGPTKTFRLNEI